jgi:hypothetical protein
MLIFSFGLFLNFEDGCDMFLRNVGWLLNGRRGVISRKIEFFSIIVGLARYNCRTTRSYLSVLPREYLWKR